MELGRTPFECELQVRPDDIGKLPSRKRSCDGYCGYTMVDLKTGRATSIPDFIREKRPTTSFFAS